MTASERVYRWLLLLYPRATRREFGGEMADLFDELYRQARDDGRLPALLFVLRTYLDLPRSAFAARRKPAPPGGRRSIARFDSARYDIRQAWRSLRRAPGFLTIAVLTLALGIGANTAIFSVVNAVLLHPLPYEEPDELVLVWSRLSDGDGIRSRIAGPDLVDFNAQAELFEGFVGASALGTNLSEGDRPERVTLSWVTEDFFSLLRVNAAVGRTFLPEDVVKRDLDDLTDPDYTPPPVPTVLSHGLWQRHFGGDPAVIGETVRINGQAMDVIGVAPDGFRLHLPADAVMPTDIDAWTLFPVDLAQGNRGGGNLTVIARLRPGVTVSQAQTEMDRIADGLRREFPEHSQLDTRFELMPLHAGVVGHVRPTLWILLGAVGFVLLIACANVANLVLVRASTRARELAVRSALGGGRGRIAQGLLAESAVISGLGALAGVGMAALGIELLLALRPDNVPRIDGVGIDGRVLAFTVIVALCTTVVLGLVPALQATKRDLTDALSVRGEGAGTGGGRWRNGLLVSEVALSLVLLIGAGLLFRSFVQLNRVELGFNPRGVLTANVSLPFFSYRDPARRLAFFDALAGRVAELPGVEAVGGITTLPLAGGDGVDWMGPYALREGDEEGWASNQADYRPVIPGYLQTVETPVLAGRALTRADNRADAPIVIVIDRELAAQEWPNANPVGERLIVQVLNEAATGSAAEWAEIVGVVESVRHTDLTGTRRGTIYVPYKAFRWFEASLVVRGVTEPAQLIESVRREVAELDAGIPVYRVRAMSEYVADGLAPTRFAMTLIGIFAAVAVLLAVVGLYGVMASQVRARRRELGVRIALGARWPDIARTVLARGVLLTIAGLGIGLLAALGLTRVLAHLLFGVTSTDPLTYLALAALLFGVAILAFLVPAGRALRVDPAKTLRVE